MRVAIAFDHAGLVLRPAVEQAVTDGGGEIVDLGTRSTEECDYPDFAFAAADAVVSGRADLAIVCCGTGIGSAMAANKVSGIRAAAVCDTFSARMSRLHNNANVLCLGGRVVGLGLARELVTAWLGTPFSGDERHRRRLGAISERERTQQC